MSDWITLTPSLVCAGLTAAQTETLGARPNQGTALDPLCVAIGEATVRVRSAVRSNGLNRLSADPQQIPPELQACATTLALLRLEQLWPLFIIGEAIEPSVAEAENTLKAVSTATQPISLPATPEPGNTVRRSAGVQLENKRANRTSARRLRGL